MVASKKKKKLYLLFHSRNFSKKNFQDAIYYTAGRKNQKDSLSWFEKNSKNFFLWFFLLEKKIFFLSKIFSLQIFFCAQKISSPNSGASPPRKRAPFRRSLAPILCDARRPSVCACVSARAALCCLRGRAYTRPSGRLAPFRCSRPSSVGTRARLTAPRHDVRSRGCAWRAYRRVSSVPRRQSSRAPVYISGREFYRAKYFFSSHPNL